MTTLRVNGKPRDVDVPANTPLLWVLRDELQLTGTKFGCGMAQCGACTVHLAGQPVRSCMTPISAVGDREVTTIEGVSGPVAQAVQGAWRRLDVVQCGYCQSGQIMSAGAPPTPEPKATDAHLVRAITGNPCRPGTRARRRDPTRAASKDLG